MAKNQQHLSGRTLFTFISLMVAGAVLWDMTGAEWYPIWISPPLPVPALIGLVILGLGYGTLGSLMPPYPVVGGALFLIVITVVLMAAISSMWYWGLVLFILGALVRLLEKKP